MRETGPVQNRSKGQNAEYYGIARTLLGMAKNIMKLGNLQQIARSVTLENGVRIFVQSVFGQDSIRVTRPAARVRQEGKEVGVRKFTTQTEIIYGMYDGGYPDYGVFYCDDGQTLVGIEGSLHWALAGVAANGRTVVGNDNADYPMGAFYWTKSVGQVDLGVAAGGSYPYARGTSENGGVIVGDSGLGAYRWVKGEGATVISAGPYATALGVSEDGRKVVGYDTAGVAYLWENGSATTLPDMVPTAIAADGSTVVGTDTGNTAVIYWTKAGGAISIPMPANADYINVYAVSANGGVIVGEMEVLLTEDFGGGPDVYSHTHPFRWEETTGIVDIGVFPTPADTYQVNNMRAQSVSPDGKIVVGQGIGVLSPGRTSYQTFRWTEETGIVSLGVLSGSFGGTSLIAVPTEYYVNGSPVSKEVYDSTTETG